MNESQLAFRKRRREEERERERLGGVFKVFTVYTDWKPDGDGQVIPD